MKSWKLLLPLAILAPTLTFASNIGDYDGGGGGTLPAHPISTREVAEFIKKEAMLNLRLYLNYQLADYQRDFVLFPGRNTILSPKIYGGPQTIRDVMENTDVEIRMDRPCFDNRGAEVDASIYADKAGSICFSAARVAPKLVKEIMRKEVLALMLHEFSHLLGTTEKEAREYQGEAAEDLSNSNRDTALKFISKLQIHAQETDADWRSLEGSFDTLDAQGMRDSFERLQHGFEVSQAYDMETSMALFDANDFAYPSLMADKLMVANWYAMAESGTGDFQYWKDQYEKIFAGQQEITVAELHQRLYHDDVKIHGDEKIRRINSRADLKAFVAEFGKYLDDSREYLEQMEHSLALGPVPGKPQPAQNPWRKFYGEYSVVSSECDNGAKPQAYTEFGVVPEQKDSPNIALQTRTANSWGNEGLYDGAGDILGGAAVFVSGDANSATRNTTFGDRWGERWIARSWKMERSGEEFLITQKILSRTGYSVPQEEVTSTCRYHLRKHVSVNI